MEVGDEGEYGGEDEQVGDGSVGTAGATELLNRLVTAHHQATENTLHKEHKHTRRMNTTYLLFSGLQECKV